MQAETNSHLSFSLYNGESLLNDKRMRALFFYLPVGQRDQVHQAFAQVPQTEGDRLDGAGQDCSKHKAQNETKNGVKNNESFLHAEASAEYAVEQRDQLEIEITFLLKH